MFVPRAPGRPGGASAAGVESQDMRREANLLFVILMAAGLSCRAAEPVYQKPPKAMLDVLNAPPPETISVSPAHDAAILMQAVAHPSIEELAQPMLRLAGLRIDVNTNGPHLMPHNISYRLLRLPGGKAEPVKLPAGPDKLGAPVWSPDGRRFAFTDTGAHAIALWVGETATGQARRIAGVRLNAVIGEPEGPYGRMGAPMVWMPDSRTLLVRLVPGGRGAPPAESMVPKGPAIQESAGHSGPVRTYEDMLNNAHDEELFDYYATAQLAFVDTGSGRVTPAGKPGIYTSLEPSPDGRTILVTRIHRPYSYLHPFRDFPTEIEVWDRTAKKLYTVASLPLADRVPIDGVRTGPRNCQWLPGEAATLVWVEAMDGGNPKEKVPHRDRIMKLAAPFSGGAREVFETEQRFSGLEPLEDGKMALVSDYDRDKRWSRTMEVDLTKPGAGARVLFSRNVQDRYRDPGTPVMETLKNGRRAVMEDNGWIYLESIGATPQGDRPFLDRYNLESGKTERLFQCGAEGYETVEAILDRKGERLLTERESPTEPPNFYLRAGERLTALTHAADPAPEVRGVHKELIKYTREDGVPLSFTLYLPPGYREGEKLPALLWAYPYEYNDAVTAGQVSGSTQRFTRLQGHLLLVLGGFAVLENAGMPVIGTPETVNNTYLDQIVMDARAAVDKAASMGVVDRDRVAVGGHSYGAFMTANLLAHCDLFHAGVAESGAYNRTLTPFGFQTERRTLWEAPDLYIKMSPFMSANHIKAPLLLIHGEADDNTGTFPINSERLYQAVRGNGGTVRLVMLPLEAHGYAARETLEHVLWEEMRWLDKYLKGPAGQGGVQ